MTKNHLLVAFRRLRRRPGTTALHVGGLAVGLLCCLLALLYVQDERAFDRHHEHAERIVQLAQARQLGDMTINLMSMDEDLVAALRSDVPTAEAVTVLDDEAGIARRPGGEGVTVEDLAFADSAFFDVFTLPLVRGDATSAFRGPNEVILTASMAARLFGDPNAEGTDPMGQPLEVQRTGFRIEDDTPLALTVVGVAADPPATSTFAYDLLISGLTPVTYRSGGSGARLAGGGPTFVRMRAAADSAALQASVAALLDTDKGGFGTFAGARAIPLLDLHREGRAGGVRFVVLFATIAALVLLLACINYANLATALSLRRATEVGVRKVLGAGRRQLAGQFFAEALLLAGGAALVALAALSVVLPGFNAFLGKAIGLSAFEPWLLATFAAAVLGAGLLAGAYPALTLARFRPSSVLKGDTVRGRGGQRIRQGLVIVQFATTAVLLGGTAIVAEQLRYAQTRDLGFAGDQTVLFDLNALGLAAEREALRTQLDALTATSATSLTSGVPGLVNTMTTFAPTGQDYGSPDDIQTWMIEADEGLADALGLHLVAGRWLQPDEAEDSVVLNETAARDLGLMTDDPEAALGQALDGRESHTVVGVLSDFHFADLRDDIEPLAIFAGDEVGYHSLLAVRLASDDLRSHLDALEAAWAEIAPGTPFAPQFLDDRFAEQLADDRTLAGLVGGVASVAVLLALFGLLGLSAYAAEQRTKEIGVRKVLGARVGHLVGLLARDFVALVGIALVVAVPVVVLLARRWLDDFAYPAPVRAEVFVALAIAMLLIAAATVSVHALRAATADPVRTLRHE
ncbi:MAG: ABC transporter permease [Bacteroidota bacterium]